MEKPFLTSKFISFYDDIPIFNDSLDFPFKTDITDIQYPNSDNIMDNIAYIKFGRNIALDKSIKNIRVIPTDLNKMSKTQILKLVDKSPLIYVNNLYSRDNMRDYFNDLRKKIRNALYDDKSFVDKLLINYLLVREEYKFGFIDNMGNKEYLYILCYDKFEDKQSLTDYFVEPIRLKCKKLNYLSYDEESRTSNFIDKNEKLPKLTAKSSYDDKLFVYNKQREYLEESSAKECGTFPYAVGYSIYTLFKPKSVLDISAGWGDRLITSALYGIEKYTGIDPNTELQESYQSMINLYVNKKNQSNYKVIPKACEDITPEDIDNQLYDIVFSSPPYFTTERYSEDESQSFKRYKNLDDWLNGFMYPSLNICYNSLKKNGMLVFVLSDTKQGENIIHLTEKVLDKCKEIGFRYRGCIPYVHYLKLYKYVPKKPSRMIVQPVWIFQK